MLEELALGFLTGLLAFNAAPHLIKGLTRERYPCFFGNGPISNFLAGWLMLTLAIMSGRALHLEASLWPLGAAALGALAIGLFHAGPGAFGYRE